MKACRAFGSLRGGDFRPWFLAIVRNTCFTLLHRRTGPRGPAEELSLEAGQDVAADAGFDPQVIAIRASDAEAVRRAIDRLPAVLREAIVLREIEGLSYKEIGKIAEIPIGTVMSRLARGRSQLQRLLVSQEVSESPTKPREGLA